MAKLAISGGGKKYFPGGKVLIYFNPVRHTGVWGAKMEKNPIVLYSNELR